MSKLKVAVVGYGNIGQYVLEAIEASVDLEVAGIVRRVAQPIEGIDYPVVASIEKLGQVDVAILSVPSRQVERYAAECLSKQICTVDSFDIHADIALLRNKLNTIAKKNNVGAITAAGWDPGTDSILRAIFLAMAPQGITYTNFGPGMSMGHTTVVKAFEGVKDALSVTMPAGAGIHRRVVYIEVASGYDFQDIKQNILNDDYFKNDETSIQVVESINALKDAGHGVNITRKGGSGKTQNQQFAFDMRINNPALTAQILVASARAVCRQSSGAYTLIEIPPIDFLYGERDKLIENLV